MGYKRRGLAPSLRLHRLAPISASPIEIKSTLLLYCEMNTPNISRRIEKGFWTAVYNGYEWKKC